jgi:hypothetical protein
MYCHLSGVPWLIIKGSGLDDWTYWHLYIYTVRDYRQLQRYRYSTHFQYTVAHALGFSVFTSRIPATDLSQSHCNFKSHVKSSFHHLITFLPFPGAINSDDQHKSLANNVLYSYSFWTPNSNSLISLVPSNWLSYIDASRTYRKHATRVRMSGSDHIENTASVIVAKACLPHSCLAIEIFVAAGMR